MKIINTIKQAYSHPRFKALLDMILEHKGRLIAAAACIAIANAATGGVTLMLKPVLDEGFGGFNEGNAIFVIVRLATAIVAIYFLRAVALYFHQYFLSYVSQDLTRKLRNMIYNKLMYVPLSFFHKEKTGVLMSRISNDVNGIQKMMMDMVMGPIRDVFSVIVFIFIIFYQIWALALIAILIMPIAYFPIVWIGRRIKKLTKKSQAALGEINAVMQESFVGIKVVKAFSREEHEIAKFSSINDELFELQRKSVKAQALGPSINEALAGLVFGVLIVVGGYCVAHGIYTIGTFGSFLMAVLLLYEPIKRLSKLNNTLQQGLAAAERVFEVLEYESPVKEIENPVIIKRKPHCVRYDNVSFSYDRGLVLKEINLTVQSGEIVALVGGSGGGKTSLVNLLPRFFDVIAGAIYIDEVDIRDASIDSLRNQVAVVTQEPILFNDTVYNNIVYGDLKATEAQVIAAAKAAYAYDFVQQFPQGFDTNIGEMGGQVSGGQKQRLCIARALLKNAPILILDEATSALDTESERLVQMALENLMRGRTTFMIAHRLSTIVNATRILVMVEGNIVEEGSHDSLMALEGEYYQLYRKQFNMEKQTADFGLASVV